MNLLKQMIEKDPSLRINFKELNKIVLSNEAFEKEKELMFYN